MLAQRALHWHLKASSHCRVTMLGCFLFQGHSELAALGNI